MNNQFPLRRAIKLHAKRLMTHPAALRATLVVVLLVVASFGIKFMLNATLAYALVDLNQYKDTATGIYFNDNGLSLIFRMDLTQSVLAIPLTYAQIVRFLVVGTVFFVIIAPLRMGAMEVYWSILRGDQTIPLRLTQWLTNAGRLCKALVVEFILYTGVRLVAILLSIPALYCYYIFYSNVTTLDQMTSQMSMIQGLGSLLALGAGLAAFWLHSFFLPVRYCMAAHPEYSLGETFRRGLASMKGYRVRFFWFRTTMIPWFFLSQATYNTLDLYVMPYTSLASMVFVQECARHRQTMAQGQELANEEDV